jgi:hypothetical protein
MLNFHKRKRYANESESEELFSELENESQTFEKSDDVKTWSLTEDISDEKKSKKKLNLIYDNSYLYKKRNKQFKIRKEIQDILNGVYNNDDNDDKKDQNEEDEILRKKYEERFLEKYLSKQKFKKRIKRKKKNVKNHKEKKAFFTDETLDKQMFDRNKEIYEKEELEEINQEKKEKNLDWRINYFFSKIKEMRNLSKNEFIKQFDKYTEFDMKDFKIKRDKETRIRDFILGLNDYRVTRKIQRKLFDTYVYKEPFLIGNYSPNKKNYSVDDNSNSDIEMKKNMNCSTDKSM